MKKIMILLVVGLAATSVFARRAKSGVAAGAGNDDGPTTAGRAARVQLDLPKLGKNCCFGAPGIAGASIIGQCYTKPRSWIVIESKYTTFAKFLEQLTFTWHVMLETKSARENKGNKIGLAPYSYFNVATTYFNIPQGGHAACVCLPPSYLELYGEPKAIGLVVSNQNGDILAGGTVSEIKGIPTDHKFWEDPKIMDAKQSNGDPFVERRQGLVDRSKTIWALVNPNDYEATVQ